MIHIGKSYIQRTGGASRLCADVTVSAQGGAGDPREGNKRTLWFSIDSRQEEYFCVGRADAFVLVMLLSALRYGHDIVCEDPMSERLHYQLCDCLIPALAFGAGGGTVYRAFDIRAADPRGVPKPKCGGHWFFRRGGLFVHRHEAREGLRVSADPYRGL